MEYAGKLCYSLIMIAFGAKKIIFVFLAVFSVVFILFFGAAKIDNRDGKKTHSDKTVSGYESVSINGINIKVNIADTAGERMAGLSGRTSLAEDEGVFFIFDSPYRYSFWMKEMNFPIDIVWIDGEFKVVDITKNAAPESFPNTFQPQVPAQYVLETVAGWTDKNNIKIGDKVILNFK